MGVEKAKYRVLEEVGEVWLTEDGLYTYRLFEFDISGSGLETVYQAEAALERRWATESMRRAGQMEGYEMHAKPKEKRYHKQAAELLRRKW